MHGNIKLRRLLSYHVDKADMTDWWDQWQLKPSLWKL